MAPTGSGKSLLIAEICRRVLTECPGTRIIQVTDTKELIQQNHDEFRKYYPEASTGIYSAGLGKKQIHADVTFVGIQSVYKHVYDFYPPIDLVIVDEAHMLPKESATRYGEFIKAVRLANPHAAFVGLTATPYRLDSGLLHEGEDRLFDGIAYDIDILKLIDQGYLAPVVSKSAAVHIDLDNVRTTAGEFNAGDLEDAAGYIVKSAVKEIVKKGADRKSWLIFAAGVDHARMIKTEFASHGISAEVVTGATPTQERDETVRRFKAGKLRCLINVAVFTKGFNHPGLDLIALMTATKSTAKYVQMVGRGMRTAEGKTDCLLLDFGENVVRHGPINLVRPKHKTKGKEDGTPPTKVCPECSSILPASAVICPECQREFPREINHEMTASSQDVIVRPEPVWVPVRSVSYSRHIKEGKPDSVKVSYLTAAGQTVNQWLSIDHGGFAARKAFEWLAKIGSDATTVNDALTDAKSGLWPKPTRIQIVQDGKFQRVLDADFSVPENNQIALFA